MSSHDSPMAAQRQQRDAFTPTRSPASRRSGGHRGRIWIGAAVGAVLALLLALGTLPRLARQRELRAELASASDAVPVVSVSAAHYGPATSDLAIPASIQGLHEAALYARSSGYVKRWLVDMGGRVQAGQLLAEIETPELDQELGQAKANLSQVQATLELTRATLRRWQELVKEDAATKQELDEKQAAFNAAEANAQAARANVERLTALKSFGRVVAPFTGVVTARNVDVGSLVSPTAGAGTKPLFTISEDDTVRLMIPVPQSFAAHVRIGQPVRVEVQDLSHGTFDGHVARTAQAIDPSTRTLLTEVRLANPGRALLPGMYAQVHFVGASNERLLLVPANTLQIRSSGAIVAVVKSGRVHLQPVTLGRDFGTEVEVKSGVVEGDQLVVNAGDEIVDGATVRVTASR